MLLVVLSLFIFTIFSFQNCGRFSGSTDLIAPAACCSLSQGVLGGEYQVPSDGQQTMAEFESMSGKRPSLVGNNSWWLDKYDWSGFKNLYANPDTGNPANNWANAVVAQGSIPVMLWNAYDPDGIDCSSAKPYFDRLLLYRASNIANGKFDNYIRKWASDIKAFGRPIWMRTMHELNSKKMLTDAQPCQSANSWDAALHINGERINTYQDVIAAWRRIVTIFREEGATNVQWVWSVLAWESIPFGGTNEVALKDIYPGDEFVDWIGIECYNLPSDTNWKILHGPRGWHLQRSQ